ncbi:hypothetical protein LguiA_025695 [Lonicera macranthoides]
MEPSWLKDDELFAGDPIVSVLPGIFDSLIDSDERVEVHVVDDDDDDDEDPPSPLASKKRVGESSSGGKSKKERLSLIDEDVEMEEHGGINPRIFDSGKFPTINSLDDDSELELDDTDYF